jgi:hypothetical protein
VDARGRGRGGARRFVFVFVFVCCLFFRGAVGAGSRPLLAPRGTQALFSVFVLVLP